MVKILKKFSKARVILTVVTILSAAPGGLVGQDHDGVALTWGDSLQIYAAALGHAADFLPPGSTVISVPEAVSGSEVGSEILAEAQVVFGHSDLRMGSREDHFVCERRACSLVAGVDSFVELARIEVVADDRVDVYLHLSVRLRNEGLADGVENRGRLVEMAPTKDGGWVIDRIRHEAIG